MSGPRASTVSYAPNLRWIDCTASGSATLTRPNDTNAYTAGDEISNNTAQGSAVSWVVPAFAREVGGRGIIRQGIIITSQNTTFAPTMLIFDTAPTMVGDNAAFSHVSGDDAKFLNSSTATFSSITAVGSQAIAIFGAALVFKCAATDTSLYMVMRAPAYTPAANQTFKIRILVEN